MEFVLAAGLVGGARIDVPISSAQLKRMKTSPIVILPPIGAGFFPQEDFAVFRYKPVSVDYSIGDATKLYIGSIAAPASLYSCSRRT